jgi:hypothetical protein
MIAATTAAAGSGSTNTLCESRTTSSSTAPTAAPDSENTRNPSGSWTQTYATANALPRR